MKILKLALIIFLATLFAWGIQTAWLKNRNNSEPSKIEKRYAGQRARFKIDHHKQERDLKRQYIERKHLATGTTVYDRIYNAPDQSLKTLIERIAKEALPDDWSCEVKVEEFTNFILLISQPHNTREKDPTSVSKYFPPIVKYCGFCLSNIAVLDHTHTSYMFFDEETLEYIEKYGSLSPQKQPNSRFAHLLGSGMAESISALGKSFNMFNSTKIQCETYESHLIVPFEVSGASGTVSSRALLDTGASTTMISSELINMTGSADLVYAPQRSFNTANGYLRCPVTAVPTFEREIDVTS